MFHQNIPIMIVHKGNSVYLKYCPELARTNNPNSRIILIGNSENDLFDFVEHHNINDYVSNQLISFQQNYQHFSPLNEQFERFCIERWFIVNEFAQRHHLKQFL